jgi:hypothetical protein
MTRKKKMTITIEVEDVTNKLYLREEIATGTTDDGRKLEVCSIVPDHSLHYKIGNKAYMVGMQRILKALLEKVGTE